MRVRHDSPCISPAAGAEVVLGRVDSCAAVAMFVTALRAGTAACPPRNHGAALHAGHSALIYTRTSVACNLLQKPFQLRLRRWRIAVGLSMSELLAALFAAVGNDKAAKLALVSVHATDGACC